MFGYREKKRNQRVVHPVKTGCGMRTGRIKMKFKLRQYQKDAVKAGLSILDIKTKANKNGILVLPTGAGKSLVIADIVAKSGKKTIVLQPSKEILEQNLSKIKAFGVKDIGIFSASMKEKTIGKITFATIGSVMKHQDKFANFELIICDECHLINSKGGQYEKFINGIKKPTIGLTATPFRMRYYRDFKTDNLVVESKFLTRTRPRIFGKILHITQVKDMFKGGFLCPVEYDCSDSYNSDEIQSNTTGQGYNDVSLSRYNINQGIVPQIIIKTANSTSKHILIFTHFRTESADVISGLKRKGIDCVEISGKTKKKDREKILADFKSGKARCVVNVGVLTVGFDFPELDCVIIGRPMKSLALFYQISGRGLRPADGKDSCKIIDLCDNVKRFGEVNSFSIEDVSDGKGMWRLKSNIGYLTGVDLVSGKDLEKSKKKNTKPAKTKRSAKKNNTETGGNIVIPFGKHAGTNLFDLDSGYLEWLSKNFDAGDWKDIFVIEVSRRAAIA